MKTLEVGKSYFDGNKDEWTIVSYSKETDLFIDNYGNMYDESGLYFGRDGNRFVDSDYGDLIIPQDTESLFNPFEHLQSGETLYWFDGEDTHTITMTETVFEDDEVARFLVIDGVKRNAEWEDCIYRHLAIFPESFKLTTEVEEKKPEYVVGEWYWVQPDAFNVAVPMEYTEEHQFEDSYSCFDESCVVVLGHIEKPDINE